MPSILRGQVLIHCPLTLKVQVEDVILDCELDHLWHLSLISCPIDSHLQSHPIDVVQHTIELGASLSLRCAGDAAKMEVIQSSDNCEVLLGKMGHNEW